MEVDSFERTAIMTLFPNNHHDNRFRYSFIETLDNLFGRVVSTNVYKANDPKLILTNHITDRSILGLKYYLIIFNSRKLILKFINTT